MNGTRLTERQYEAVRRLALGQTWAVIIADMGISRNSLKGLRNGALARYDVSCLADLWRAMGWLQVPE